MFFFAMISVCAAAQFAFAQSTTKLTVEDRELVTDDDLKLKITYFKSTSGKDAPVVILLHGKGGTRQNWKGLATDLQKNGDFAVVTVDLRGHGESLLGNHKKADLKKGDYQSMVEFDLKAVKDFLLEEHQKGNVNINKLGIVACDFSASVAVMFAELDWEKPPYDDSPIAADKTPRGQDVQALIVISPELNTPGLLTANAVKTIRGLKRPVMIGVAEKNGRDTSAANKLYEQLSPKKDRDKEKEEHVMMLKYDGELRGIDLVNQNGDVRKHIFAFLTKFVKEYPTEWRDRRSRLERE